MWLVESKRDGESGPVLLGFGVSIYRRILMQLEIDGGGYKTVMFSRGRCWAIKKCPKKLC